ncbi:hypothetical protein [Bradyrhizobium phage BDU-MI-1]|nr:hypothetical protein [Bradyrhizobium phage BDU-MI-1]
MEGQTLMQPVEFHPFEHAFDPKVVESLHRTARQTRTMTAAGVDVFEFRSTTDGTHYVVNRATAARCMTFDQFVAFTSARMVEALGRHWSRPGVC